MEQLKSPYVYFGGKSKVASVIWQGLGDVENYIEPFAGSLVVLLKNPNPAKIETINDKDCAVSNFWRAIKSDPDKVAEYTMEPLHETDYHAKQHYLKNLATEQFIKSMHEDIDFCDHRAAGYWVWGLNCSIGTSWMNKKGLTSLPALSCNMGTFAESMKPQEYFVKLAERIQKTRVMAGDWKRVLSPSVSFSNKNLSKTGLVGVFLDPPYDKTQRKTVYKEDKDNIFPEVCKWAIENGENPKMRIAVCGYDGGYEFPETWQKYNWSANGGYGNTGVEDDTRAKENKAKEMIWFSPNCLKIIPAI